MLQLSPCHLNGIPKQYYIPDFRFLLECPKQSLALLDCMEEQLWEATKKFIADNDWRKTIYKDPSITDEAIRESVVTSFNFPPSQFQLHIQWILPPLTPFQHYMAETKNHFHEGRAIPLPWVRKILALDKPYPEKITKDTSLESIFKWAKEIGVDYTPYWTEWYQKMGLDGTLNKQNWNAEDFEYVVQDKKVYKFSIEEEGGTKKIKLGEEAPDVKADDVQNSDKTLLQNYGRPYNDAGKPSGTYIQNPLTPKFGIGGLLEWPPAAL